MVNVHIYSVLLFLRSGTLDTIGEFFREYSNGGLVQGGMGHWRIVGDGLTTIDFLGLAWERFEEWRKIPYRHVLGWQPTFVADVYVKGGAPPTWGVEALRNLVIALLERFGGSVLGESSKPLEDRSVFSLADVRSGQNAQGERFPCEHL